MKSINTESMLLPSQATPHPHPNLERVFDQSTHENKLPQKADNASSGVIGT